MASHAAVTKRRFAIFRTAYALVLLADLSFLYTHLRLFPTTPSEIRPALLAWLVILVAMIAGFRIAILANYVLCVTIIGVVAPRVGFDQSAADSITISLALIAAAYTILENRLPIRLVLAVFLSAIYIDSGIHKLLSPMWRNGYGVSTPMELPGLLWVNVGCMRYLPSTLFRLLSWGVIGFELSFPGFYFCPKTQVAILFSGIAMHLGIALLYPIPVFSGIMIAIYLGIFPDNFYRWVGPSHLRDVEPPVKGCATSCVRALLPILALWTISTSCLYASILISRSSMSTRARTVNRILYLMNRVFYITTGNATHGVFADRLFREYNYQLRLVGPHETVVPYSKNNLFAWAVRDRTWNDWWKCVQAPWNSAVDRETGLTRWAHFYWPVLRTDERVRIERRPQTVYLNLIRPDLFESNNAVPWRSIGEITSTNDEYHVSLFAQQ